VQVDPIRPTSKPPGTKCLILKYGTLLSSFASKFDLRRYKLVRELKRTPYRPKYTILGRACQVSLATSCDVIQLKSQELTGGLAPTLDTGCTTRTADKTRDQSAVDDII